MGTGSHHIGFFNPGDAHPMPASCAWSTTGKQAANVTITGVDDHGETPGTGVEVPIAAGGSRTLTAEDLETGGDGLTGNLGNGTGKWRLSVSADQPVTVVNLLEGPAGLLSNLSSVPPVGPRINGAHEVPLFPGSSSPELAGLRTGDQPFGRRRHQSTSMPRTPRAGTYGTLTLTVDANAAVQFDTDDLELGNAEAGLSAGVGAGEGDWRLALSSDLRTSRCSRSSAPKTASSPQCTPSFPQSASATGCRSSTRASNRAQVSRLRLENRGTAPAKISIRGNRRSWHVARQGHRAFPGRGADQNTNRG